MAINNISNINTASVLNISAQSQAQNTSKLSSGFKINRDNDTAATMTLSAKGGINKAENVQASMSDINDIDKVDEIISQAQKNILSAPQDAVMAQANQTSAVAISLIN